MEFVLQSLQFLKLVSQFPLSKTDKWYVFIDFIFIILIVKPSISTHSKPHMMPHMRLLKHFVLQHSVSKTKQGNVAKKCQFMMNNSLAYLMDDYGEEQIITR